MAGVKIPLQPENVSEQARRTELATRTALHLWYLLGQTLSYLWRTLLDLIDAARRMLLRRNRDKYPDRAAEFDSAITRINQRGAERWSSWTSLPQGRRIEIRLAASLLMIVVILSGRAYFERSPHPTERIERQTAKATVPERSSNRATERALMNPSAPDYAAKFASYRKAAAPGEWIMYGVEPLAEAQTNYDKAWAEYVSSGNELTAALRVLRQYQYGQPGYDSAHAAERAAEAKERAANDAQLAAQRALDRAKHAAPTPVLERGHVYDWDGFKIISPVVLKEGTSYRMWYIGCHFLGDDYTCAVGHARSADGIRWTKTPQPVLTISEPPASWYLSSIAVVHTHNEYLMWYSFAASITDWCASMNLATSRDGLVWTPEGLVHKGNCEEPGGFGQSAYYDGKVIHLWYSDFDVSADGNLVHLTSADGRSWQKAGSTDWGALTNIPHQPWMYLDATGYRAVFIAGRSGFAMARSADGSTWTLTNDAPQLRPLWNEDPKTPVIIAEPDGVWMWFAAASPDDSEIALAFQKRAPR